MVILPLCQTYNQSQKLEGHIPWDWIQLQLIQTLNIFKESEGHHLDLVWHFFYLIAPPCMPTIPKVTICSKIISGTPAIYRQLPANQQTGGKGGREHVPAFEVTSQLFLHPRG